MAYLPKYRVYFADIDAAEYKAEISFDGYGGSVIELQGSGNACVIDFGNVEDKFETINGSGCTLNFYNDGYNLEDLFVVSPTEAKCIVYRKKDLYWYEIWTGYLNTEVYDEDYSWDNGSVAVTANDGLNAIGREKYFSGSDLTSSGLVPSPWTLGSETIPNVIANCLSDLTFSRIYTVIDVIGARSPFEFLSVDLSNYVDEDSESMTKRAVLESILKPFNLRLFVFGYACWIVDPTLFANSDIVSYKAYDNTFSSVAEDSTITPTFDISNGDAIFYGGNQRISLVGGFKTMISNYSAYPDAKKLVPTDLELVGLDPSDDTTEWSTVFTAIYRPISDYLSSEYGFEFNATAGLTEYNIFIEGAVQRAIELLRSKKSTYAGTRSITMHPSFKSSSSGAGTDPNESAIIYKGGYIAKSDDTIIVNFDVYCAMDHPYALRRIYMPLKVKIGNQWGTTIAGHDNTFSTWNTIEASDDITVGVDPRNTTVPFSFSIANIPNDGLVEIHFCREVTVVRTDGTPSYVSSEDGIVFIKNFSIAINDLEINDDDVEYKVESNVNFLSKKTIEINNSSRRENGILDRGGFINGLGKQETNFIRISYPQLGSMGLTIGQAYLSNYLDPFRRMTATIKVDELLRNTSGITSYTDVPLTLNGIFSPISVIKDSNELGSKKFTFMGGSVDLIEKTLNGTWDETMNANYIIT